MRIHLRFVVIVIAQRRVDLRQRQVPVLEVDFLRTPPVGNHVKGEWQKHLLATATERVKRQVKAEHFQMFDFYVLQAWPVREVARVLNVSVAQVYLAKHRVGALLKKELKRLAQGL